MKRLITLLAALVLATAHAATDVPASLAGTITAARAALEDAKLDDTQRKAASDALADAAQTDGAADATIEQATLLRQQDAQALPPEAPRPPSLAERRQQLQQWAARVPANANAATLERLLASERASVARTRRALDETHSALTELMSRPSPVPSELAALRQRIEAPPPVAVDGEAAAAAQARALRHQAQQRAALAELALRDAQQATAQRRQLRLEREANALRLQLDEYQPRVAWLEQRIAENSRARYTEQARALQEMAGALPAGASQAQAQRNADLAADILNHSRRLTAERGRLAEQERTRDQISAALRDTEARLRVGGNSDAIGQWLWQQRLALPSTSSLRVQRRSVQDELGGLRLALFNTAKQSADLAGGTASPAAGVLAVLGEEPAPPPPDADPDTVRQRALAATQADLLTQLEPLLRRRIDVLEQSDAALQVLTDNGDALQELMARQLLWTPSHAPVGSAWLGAWRQAHLGPHDVVGGAGLLVRDLGERAAAWATSVLAVLLVLGLRRHAVRRLKVLGQRVADPTHDRLRYTVQALLWSVAIALPAALAAWLLGLRLQAVAVNSHVGLAVLGQALQGLAWLLLLLGLVSALLRDGGLADAHLRWSRERLAALNRAWKAVLLVALPAHFIILLTLQSENAAAIDTWARVAVLVYGLGMGAVALRLSRQMSSPSASASQPSISRRVGGALLPLAFGATALMALTGYIYTAVVLQGALLQTAAVLLAVAVIDGLLRRWLLLGEQRLAMRQRAAQAEVAVPDVEGGEAAPAPDSELTLVAISAQARRLLRLLRIALVTVGVLWACREVLPALLRFDDIQLWDGAKAPVTLMDVLAAAVLLALTASLARNLPGLLEMALTPYARISAAGRYTATTLARYAVVIAGALFAFSALGLAWSQLQWMAAALTVGLGFGLQEIFANFVSGLILLVERPFRVGDTITIGDLTGNVTRIHTRATTVLDYDNKEIIIPNKTFITGQVTNWTLTDNVTRLTLNVGVAYGSPPTQVRELLLDVARRHPQVLDDPAPNCWFMALGDSTLDFELRVYVATLGDRLVVRHELLTHITESLAEAGIEIAFPQMDLHVRDLPLPPPSQAPRPT